MALNISRQLVVVLSGVIADQVLQFSRRKTGRTFVQAAAEHVLDECKFGFQFRVEINQTKVVKNELPALDTILSVNIVPRERDGALGGNLKRGSLVVSPTPKSVTRKTNRGPLTLYDD
jgi:hypothetical protein